LQKLTTESEEDIAKFKELLATEADKRKKVEQVAKECEQSVLQVISTLEKVQKEFAEKEKALLLRAESAEEQLETANSKLKAIVTQINQLTLAAFGKPASLSANSLC
jgi:predicted translin family RNA/ssDNA-binding protein